MKQTYLFWLLCGMFLISCNNAKDVVPRENTEYYNIPTYTTVYEIVYPDTTIRNTCKSHGTVITTSYKGTNSLYSVKPKTKSMGLYFDVEWWKEEWDNTEPNISTTAPIRIISQKVEYKKVKKTY